MSNIIIYGGQGYIGKHIVEKLHKKHEIYNISPDKFKKNEYLSYSHISGQLWNNFPIIIEIAPKYFIINFFGNPDINSEYLYEKIIRAILKINKILANKVNFIFLSSQLVYGNKCPGLKSENDQLFPISMYAKKCKEMEGLLITNMKNPYIILRVPILYGNSGYVTGYKNIVNKFINIVSSGKNIQIYGDGKHQRTFLHVSDLAIFIEKIIDAGVEEEIINASTGDFISVIEVANLIAKRFGVTVINNVKWPDKKLSLEARDIRLSYKKARHIFTGENNFRQYIYSEKKL